MLDLDAVTALGIVVAELVSNAYLHAFADGKGTITVSLHQPDGGDSATLAVPDDGVGLTESGDNKRHGLSLVRRLAQQVQGTLKVIAEEGTCWTLTFPSTADKATA